MVGDRHTAQLVCQLYFRVAMSNLILLDPVRYQTECDPCLFTLNHRVATKLQLRCMNVTPWSITRSRNSHPLPTVSAGISETRMSIRIEGEKVFGDHCVMDGISLPLVDAW